MSPKRVGFLIYPAMQALDLVGPMDAFSAVTLADSQSTQRWPRHEIPGRNYWRVHRERSGHPAHRLGSGGYCVSRRVHSESSLRTARLNRPMPTVVDHRLDTVLRQIGQPLCNACRGARDRCVVAPNGRFDYVIAHAYAS